MNLNISKKTAIVVLFAFLVNTFGPLPLAHADDFVLPAPGVMVRLSPEFDPPILKGIKVHPENPFRFEFILDKGESSLSNDALKDESSKLIKYFLASLTIPEKDLWVNLSPYEKDRIIPQSFGLTEMGRDLLAEDYMLKQITASLIYPEDGIGKKFWKRIYQEAAKKFGTTNIPVNTFNKVWIVPEKAIVFENAKAGTAYVVESKLKVMLEQDYLSFEKHEGIQTAQARVKNTNQLGSQVVREIVIPELTKEVNEDKNFAHLRQVYNSLILATWYKKKIKDSILEQVYADKKKVAGVNINDPQETQRIYKRYLQAFKKGVYNYIKEEIDPLTQETVPKKYFSGGTIFDAASMSKAMIFSSDAAILSQSESDRAQMAVGVNFIQAPVVNDQAMGSAIVFPAITNEEVEGYLAEAIKWGNFYSDGEPLLKIAESRNTEESIQALSAIKEIVLKTNSESAVSQIIGGLLNRVMSRRINSSSPTDKYIVRAASEIIRMAFEKEYELSKRESLREGINSGTFEWLLAGYIKIVYENKICANKTLLQIISKYVSGEDWELVIKNRLSPVDEIETIENFLWLIDPQQNRYVLNNLMRNSLSHYWPDVLEILVAANDRRFELLFKLNDAFNDIALRGLQDDLSSEKHLSKNILLRKGRVTSVSALIFDLLIRYRQPPEVYQKLWDFNNQNSNEQNVIGKRRLLLVLVHDMQDESYRQAYLGSKVPFTWLYEISRALDPESFMVAVHLTAMAGMFLEKNGEFSIQKMVTAYANQFLDDDKQLPMPRIEGDALKFFKFGDRSFIKLLPKPKDAPKGYRPRFEVEKQFLLTDIDDAKKGLGFISESQQLKALSELHGGRIKFIKVDAPNRTVVYDADDHLFIYSTEELREYLPQEELMRGYKETLARTLSQIYNLWGMGKVHTAVSRLMHRDRQGGNVPFVYWTESTLNEMAQGRIAQALSGNPRDGGYIREMNNYMGQDSNIRWRMGLVDAEHVVDNADVGQFWASLFDMVMNFSYSGVYANHLNNDQMWEIFSAVEFKYGTDDIREVFIFSIREFLDELWDAMREHIDKISYSDYGLIKRYIELSLPHHVKHMPEAIVWDGHEYEVGIHLIQPKIRPMLDQRELLAAREVMQLPVHRYLVKPLVNDFVHAGRMLDKIAEGVRGPRQESGIIVPGTPDFNEWVKKLSPRKRELLEHSLRRGVPADKIIGELIEERLSAIFSVVEPRPRDRAMKAGERAKNVQEAKTGGIDFTNDKTPLEIKNPGGSIKFHLDPAMLQELKNAPGFVPVVISIEPLRDLRGFLTGVTRIPSCHNWYTFKSR